MYMLTLLLVVSTQLFSLPACAGDSAIGIETPIADGCKQPRQGPPGPRGHRGRQGEPGAFSPSFLSVFRSINQKGGIAPGAALIFNHLAIPVQGSELSYDKTTGTVTFNQTGFFEVTFGASMRKDNRAGGLVLQMNPAGVYAATPGFAPGTGLVPGSEVDNAFPEELISLSVIVEATSVGQTMQVVNGNIPGFDINLHADASHTDLTPIKAYLVVKKLQ